MKTIMFLVGGLVLTSALAPKAHADDVKLYFDKAAFIADTGASSATGPLPDVGVVLDADVDPPVSSYVLGSLTFGLTLGSDNVAVGAAGTAAEPDWYPQTPGNDMAFGLGALPGLDLRPGVLVRLRHRRAGRDDA